VVGIDEWAIRKGQRYGVLVVDLERRQPIAVLAEYTPSAITTWLQAHPTIEIIARDRASIYTDAIAQGAPNAEQVADRWHLTHNLGTALHELLSHHTKALRTAGTPLPIDAMPVPSVTNLPPPEPPGHIVGPVELRQMQFAEAKLLHDLGKSDSEIARRLQLNRRTVRRYIHADDLPRRVLPQATSRVTPYLSYVHERWAAGCQSGIILWAELKAQGFRGSLSSIYRALRHIRAVHPSPANATSTQPHTRSPRQAMWLLVRPESELTEEDVVYRQRLCASEPLLATAATLGQRFLTLIRERQVEHLDTWLTDAEESTIKELRRFAQSLRRDYESVKSALTSPWSNGQTEGHINRLKMIKRSMFGRASINLLRNRVLYCS
jgi:transposase